MADMKKTRASHEVDMVHGPLAGKIFLFAVPVALTGIIQQLFNAADVAVVGQFVGKEAMAAVGSNSPVIGLMVNLFIGVSLGANVVISMATGSGDEKTISRSVHTSVLIALISGVIMMLIGEFISRPLLTMMGVPGDIMPMALAYLRTYLIGLPVIFLYNFESAVFRSHGDTRTPLICLIISGLLNVVLNLFFVIIVGMTADGVALATVISNLVSSSLMFIILTRSSGAYRIEINKLRIDINIMKRIFKIGIPAGLQGMVFSISNICVQSAVNSLGSDIMAASSAAFNIEILAYYIINSFGQACTTFTGQNRGAAEMRRCRSVLRISLGQALVGCGLIIVALLLPGKYLLGIFNSDPIVAEYGIIRMTYILAFEFLNAFMEVFSGALRGHGYSLAPALITLFGVCGVRILWVLTYFQSHHTFDVLMSVYPISWAVTAAVIFIYYMAKRKKIYSVPPEARTAVQNK